VKGIDQYHWKAPPGWAVTPNSAGDCAKIDAPPNLAADQTGNIDVYGTLLPISADTLPKTRKVTIEMATVASSSPTISVGPTATPKKKHITVSFTKWPAHFRWTAKSFGIGTGVEIHAAGGGPRTFLMIDNELLLIETAMDNSCGTVAGPVFEYRLKNGAMVPVELQ
jgi:hypothetical protein